MRKHRLETNHNLKHKVMKSLQIESFSYQKTVEEIYYPCFMVNKERTEWMAIIDELNVIAIKVWPDAVNVRKFTTNDSVWRKDILEAHKTFHSITEQAFFEKLNQVTLEISMMPVLEERINSNQTV